jgi:hypothetical protein
MNIPNLGRLLGAGLLALLLNGLASHLESQDDDRLVDAAAPAVTTGSKGAQAAAAAAEKADARNDRGL